MPQAAHAPVSKPSSLPPFRTAFLLFIYAALILLAIPLLIFCALTGFKNLLIEYGKAAMRLSALVLGIRIEVEGRDRVDCKTPCVFMPNHMSFIDGPLMETVLPVPARIILKKAVFGVPVLGIAMRYVGFIPVDRKGAQGGRKSIGRAVRLMHEKGYSFLVFPEGTRSRDGSMQAFRRGGFFLALESGASIVPVTIRGTFDLMPRGQWYARSGRIRVVFHDPVPVTGYTLDTMGELMERVRKAIAGG